MIQINSIYFGLQLWQWFIIAIIVFLCANYLLYMFYDGVVAPMRADAEKEGFTGQQEEQLDNPSATDWLDNLALYDDFYASIYDKLVQGDKRSMLEVALLERDWKKATPTMQLSEWRVLDVGCGTGITTIGFAKLGCAKVVGVDRSGPMIRRAQTITMPAATLTDAQRAVIEWRNGDIEQLELAQQAEFTHACVMYFSYYYITDQAAFFRNMSYWVIPGGVLSINVVNKSKFDPMLEAAAPTLFSLQKYSQERIMRSRVAFDTFDYEGVFNVDETPGATAAEFRETFRYKNNGTIRRQRHIFNMPDMKDIVELGTTAGWQYRGYIDNTTTGFEYSYTLLFTNGLAAAVAPVVVQTTA
jgi:ubiquinone/menaquinone biosynthesis C-methylase UbiE